MGKLKKCNTCKEMLPFENFHKDIHNLKYSLIGHCKACEKKKSRQRALDGKYKNYYDRHKDDPEFKQKIIEMNRKSNLKYPEKIKARSIFSAARKAGKILKTPCIECGEIKSFGHHSDYSKPLDVTWLCRLHHEERHHGKIT